MRIHPMHCSLLTQVAAKLLVALQAHENTAGHAQQEEQAVRLTMQLEHAAKKAVERRFAHPAEVLGLAESAATLMVGKLSDTQALDAAAEQELVEASVQQARSLFQAIGTGYKNRHQDSAMPGTGSQGEPAPPPPPPRIPGL